jgi:hypothetical protein
MGLLPDLFGVAGNTVGKKRLRCGSAETWR